MSDTVVFIPAWNEEENLPAVLDDLRRELPDADVLVVDDGSTDGTVEVALRQGAEVLSLGSNRGLPIGIAAGYRWALDHGYAYCGRVDADGQHPSAELKRLLAIVREGEYDVAVGSRFVSGDGYEPYRYVPSPARRLGTALLRRGMRLALRRPFADATSGLYAVNGKALPLLAEPFSDGGAGGRSPHSAQRRRAARRGGSCADGAAGGRRLEAPRPEGRQGHCDCGRHTRRREAPFGAEVRLVARATRD
jgi:glycosyltransferase involved in cell wall biosynthesis